MSRWPDHIAAAAGTIFASPKDDAFLEVFFHRWGGYDTDSLARALAAGEADDRLFAILALAILALSGGHPNATRDLLMPCLQSGEPLERWSSALGLGRLKDPGAIPTLVTMLTEFLPPDVVPPPSWLCWQWRPLVPGILAGYGLPSLAPALREALQHCIAIQPSLPVDQEPIPTLNQADMADYQDRIVYSLGRIGALGSLTGIQADQERINLWRIHLIMGSLEGRYTLTSFWFWREHPELRQEVLRLLAEMFGLDVQEQERSLVLYDIEKGVEIWERWRGRPLFSAPGS